MNRKHIFIIMALLLGIGVCMIAQESTSTPPPTANPTTTPSVTSVSTPGDTPVATDFATPDASETSVPTPTCFPCTTTLYVYVHDAVTGLMIQGACVAGSSYCTNSSGYVMLPGHATCEAAFTASVTVQADGYETQTISGTFGCGSSVHFYLEPASGNPTDSPEVTIIPLITLEPTEPPTETDPPAVTDPPVTGCTCVNLCSSLTAITVPFAKDGSGEFCYTASSLASYVNSWNADAVNVNGVVCTNTYTASSSIAAIGGVYYIYLKASYSWSHLEIK